MYVQRAEPELLQWTYFFDIISLDKYNFLEFILCSSKHKRLSASKRCEIHKKLSSFFFSIFVNTFEGFVFILEFKS